MNIVVNLKDVIEVVLLVIVLVVFGGVYLYEFIKNKIKEAKRKKSGDK